MTETGGDDSTQQIIREQFEQLPEQAKLPLAQDLMGIASVGAVAPPKNDKYLTSVWKAFFLVLGLLAVIFAVGAVILLFDGKTTEGAMLITPATAIFTGLLGLFAPSPATQGSPE